MLTLSVSQKQLSKTVIVNCQCHKDRSKDNFPRQSQTVSVTKTAPKTTFQDTVNVNSVSVTKTAFQDTMLTLSMSQRQLYKTTVQDTVNVNSVSVTKTASKTTFQDTVNVYSVRVTKTASKTTFKDTFNVYSLTKTAFQDTANAKQAFKKIFYLSGCNKPQPQPDKYNIFIYYCLTVSFVPLKKGLTPKICNFFFTVILKKRSFQLFMCLDFTNPPSKAQDNFLAKTPFKTWSTSSRQLPTDQ